MKQYKIFMLKGVFSLLLTFVSAFWLNAEQPLMKLWYTRPAQNWMTSALPIGNGELGGLFFGGIACERLQFNEKTLWTGSETKRGAYQSFGNLYIDFAEHNGEAVDYCRELCLDNAIGSVSYEMNGVKYRREYFASYPDRVIVMRITTPGMKGRLNLSVRLEDSHFGQLSVNKNILGIQGQLDLLSYDAQVKVLNEKGQLSVVDNRLTVCDADAVTILLVAGTNFNISATDYLGTSSEDLHKELYTRLSNASRKNYAALKNIHLKDYQSLFSRVKLDLQADMPEYPTDELVRNHKESRYLDMLYFQYGRYLMLGSSRGMNLPNNLQGIWNADNTPPWECDIHSNINIQMNYWPAEITNLPECHLPFLQYIAVEAVGKPNGSWRRIAQGEGLRGWTIKTQNNIFGYSDWNINRPANAWYCTHLWQHYAYNNDLEYLRNIAFPVMQSTCKYWFDRLKENKDGKLVAPDEWSPEQGPWEDGVAYAQQLVWQLFNETLHAVEALKKVDIRIDNVFVSELADKFRKLDNGVSVGSWGQIKEWKEDKGKLDFQGNDHRHLSQLIALYPGNQISYHRDTLLADAAKVTLQSRGDMGTGWSRAWKIACWARLFDGDHAYRLLKSALSLSTLTVISMDNSKGGVYENLFDSHPPFQIDGNLGATAGIAEMLLQSNQGFIHLLPALPLAWSDGSVAGLRTEGDFTFTMKWNAGWLTQCSVLSGSGLKCRIYSPKGLIARVENSSGKRIPISLIKGGLIEFPTKKGEIYNISVSKIY